MSDEQKTDAAETALAPLGREAGLVVNDESAFANLLDTNRFEHMWRIATCFSKSKLVPAHFQNEPESCFIACQMAVRLQVDPFMFMQNTYVVSGKPGMEAKLAIALVNSVGPFTGPIQYELSGTGDGTDGDGRQCRAYATHAKTDQVCEMTVTMKIAQDEGWAKRNPKWQTITDLMLCYRAASWLARLYAPECLMGMQTVDELHDVGGVGPGFAENNGEPPVGRREFFNPANAQGAEVIETTATPTTEPTDPTSETATTAGGPSTASETTVPTAEAPAAAESEGGDIGAKRLAILVKMVVNKASLDPTDAEDRVNEWLRRMKYTQEQLADNGTWQIVNSKASADGWVQALGVAA